MIMTRMQAAAALVLTASVVGVGWLVHQQVDGLKQELAALRHELNAQRESARPARPPADAPPMLYQGKPVSYWLRQFRDRASECRRKAVEPLANIAKVDRSLIPVLLGALNDDSESVRQEAAQQCQNLDLPAREGALALIHANLRADLVLNTLLRIDPKGEAIVPIALAALKDKRPRVRQVAAFALYAFDKAKVRQAIPAYIESLKRGRNNPPYYIPNLVEDRQKQEYDNLVAIAILGAIGPEAQEALPYLVEVLMLIPSGGLGDSVEGYGAIARSAEDREKTTNWGEAAVLASALKKIDPRGDRVVPLLAKVRSARGDSTELRVRAINCMQGLGKPAVANVLPAVLPYIEAGESAECWAALWVVNELGPTAASALPALLKHLQPPEVAYRITAEAPNCDGLAAEALGHMGAKAKRAFPILLKKWQQGKGNDNRDTYAFALFKIDPKAAAKAGVERPKEK